MGKQTISKLVVRSHAGERSEIPLGPGSMVIGRSPDCDVALGDQYVSWHHARIDIRGNRYVLTDEGSTNGTYVGGIRISEPRSLADGDEIRVGNTLLLYLSERPGRRATKRVESPAEDQPQLRVRVDVRAREVWVEGEKLGTRFAPLEFKLLAYLCSRPNAVCTRDELGIELWGDRAYGYEMLHQLMHRLRRRMEPDPDNPRYILAVPGVGYRLRC